MITLTCTSCRQVLQIDDAFAGGVCRCVHCGTIQTVPHISKRLGRPTSPVEAAKATAAKVMAGPPTPPPAPAPGTGLDELAQVVASSGLGTGLKSQRLRRSNETPQPSPIASLFASLSARPMFIPIVAIGAASVLLVGIIVGLLLSRGDDPTPADNSSQASNVSSGADNTPLAPAIKGPTCMGIPLQGPSVIYLLDRGNGTSETFGAMKAGVYKSLQTLGGGTKFQVIFWMTDQPLEYPKDAMRYATGDNVEQARKVLDEAYAFGSSKIDGPLDKALRQDPAEIIIATGKGGLDDEFVKTVMDLRKNRTTKIHTFSLGRFGSPDALRKIATRTGGRFREVPDAELREYLR